MDPDTNEEEISSTLLMQNHQPKHGKMKFYIGIVALLLVDVIWVASSELSSYLFKDIKFDKPYMSTYVKTSMFSLYLIGFILYGPWRRQCIRCACDDYPGQYQLVGETDTDTDDGDYTLRGSLSESIYVPAKIPSASEVESCSDEASSSPRARVKFNNLMEVKHLEDSADALIARMNYAAALRAKFLRKASKGKLTLPQIVRISILFTPVFFLGNLAYQEALALNTVAVVNILSATSGIFTLVLAAMFPSGSSDKFSITKLFAVLISFAGAVLVTLSSEGTDPSKIMLSNVATTGALWSLLGAFCYALYLVLLKRSVGEEGQLDIPMFFGFVGLFCLALLWPGMVVFHYLNFETFQLPSRLPAILLVVNGLIGTVLSELLWMWGCLATSSLMGTLSLGLTLPLSIIVDIVVRKVTYSWLFYVGVANALLSFVIVSYVSHQNLSKDPILNCLKKFCCCCKKKKMDYEKIQEIPLIAAEKEA